jgi:hypothetical protein
MTSPVQGSLITPSINVLGAFFPDWMFCIAGALVLTIGVRVLLVRAGLNARMGLGSRTLFYPALGVVLALLGWLAFFTD